MTQLSLSLESPNSPRWRRSFLPLRGEGYVWRRDFPVGNVLHRPAPLSNEA
jgi:hypothetical protein